MNTYLGGEHGGLLCRCCIAHGCVPKIAMRASASLIAAALVLIARGVAALEFDLQSQHKCIFEVRRYETICSNSFSVTDLTCLQEINANVIVVGDWAAFHKDNEHADQQVDIKVRPLTGFGLLPHGAWGDVTAVSHAPGMASWCRWRTLTGPYCMSRGPRPTGSLYSPPKLLGNTRRASWFRVRRYD